MLQSTYPGMERPLALSLPDSLRHLHIIGPTGVGKSTLLLGLICQDMAAGRGVIVVDPKGGLVADALDRVSASSIPMWQKPPIAPDRRDRDAGTCALRRTGRVGGIAR